MITGGGVPLPPQRPALTSRSSRFWPPSSALAHTTLTLVAPAARARGAAARHLPAVQRQASDRHRLAPPSGHACIRGRRAAAGVAAAGHPPTLSAAAVRKSHRLRRESSRVTCTAGHGTQPPVTAQHHPRQLLLLDPHGMPAPVTSSATAGRRTVLQCRQHAMGLCMWHPLVVGLAGMRAIKTATCVKFWRSGPAAIPPARCPNHAHLPVRAHNGQHQARQPGARAHVYQPHGPGAAGASAWAAAATVAGGADLGLQDGQQRHGVLYVALPGL